MEKYKYCQNCGKEINSNIKLCQDCLDIKLYGSKENAMKTATENFKKIGL